jgi:hypothetical protein
MMDAIWSTTMKTIYDRYRRPQQSTILADIPLAKFKERQKASQRFCIFQSKAGVCQVQDPNSGLKFTINLAENWCTCRNFWQYHGPCAHAIAACRHEVEDPYEHFAKTLTVRYYRQSYGVAIPPVSIEGLSSDPKILPPKLVRKRGRPRQKRIRKGAWERKQTRCANCLQLGHNKRRCTKQPAKNSRAKRVHDWIETSETDSEAERELAPILVAARARKRAREEATNGSNDKESELSDLRSSEFEGIEEDIVLGTVVAKSSCKAKDSETKGSEVEGSETKAAALQLRPKRAKRVPARYS